MSENISAREQSAVLASCLHLFRCPICSAKLEMSRSRTVICHNRHCFDIARQGYVNLFAKPVKTKYDRAMFTGRTAVFQNGLFDPLLERIAGKLGGKFQARNVNCVLDAGCGEGSLQHSVRMKLMPTLQKGCSVQVVGIDLSKEGIASAASAYKEAAWCVADIARCPFAARSFDAILNVFSPANYEEFSRLLTDDGLIVKVVAGQQHFQEIRHALYGTTARQGDCGLRTEEHFRSHFHMTDREHLRYETAVSPESIAPLLAMSPLAWGADPVRLQQVQRESLRHITIDVHVLVGRQREKEY